MTKHTGRAATLMLLVFGIAAGSVALATEAAPTVTEPTVIGKYQVAPVYPPAAEMARFHGSVTVAAAVDAFGTVTDVQLVDSDHPNLGFEDAAMDAVRQWKFRPARIGEEAVDAVTYIRLQFRTHGSVRRHGYVSGGLIASSVGVPAIGGVGVGKNLPIPGSDQMASRAPSQRVQEVNLPPGVVGQLYDARKLIPKQSILVDNPGPYSGSGISPGP